MVDENFNPVQYASVFQESNKLFLVTNDSGVVRLGAGEYRLSITHVSFNTKTVEISVAKTDTLIKVNLFRKESLIEEVVFISKKIEKAKQRRVGSYELYSKATFNFYSALVVGIKCPPVNDVNKINILTKIQFRSENVSQAIPENLKIEIKIFGINADTLTSTPLNYLPIYLNSKDLDGNVTINLGEKIFIPKDGVLLTFELPPIAKFPEKILTFTGNFKSTNGVVYVKANNGVSWNIKPLYSYAYRLHKVNEMFFLPNLKIQYLEYEK